MGRSYWVLSENDTWTRGLGSRCLSLARWVFPPIHGDDRTVRLWKIDGPQPESKMTMIGHENAILCCIFAPPSCYQHLATLAGLSILPPRSSIAEFMATGSRDKTIKLWDSRGSCIKTLIGHDNCVRALAFHPCGKYLLSVSDDKSLQCWDLTQDGKCVRTLANRHDHFTSCLTWAPPIAKSKHKHAPNGDANAAPTKTGAMPRSCRLGVL